MHLLTALIVKNSHGLAGIYVIFLKKRSRPKREKFSIPKLEHSEKIGKIVIKCDKFHDFFAN